MSSWFTTSVQSVLVHDCRLFPWSPDRNIVNLLKQYHTCTPLSERMTYDTQCPLLGNQAWPWLIAWVTSSVWWIWCLSYWLTLPQYCMVQYPKKVETGKSWVVTKSDLNQLTVVCNSRQTDSRLTADRQHYWTSVLFVWCINKEESIITSYDTSSHWV